MLKQVGEKIQSTSANEQQKKTELIQPTRAEKDAKKVTLYHEIGTKITSGELSPEDTAGIVKTLLFQGDERMALRICAVAKLDPLAIRSLFAKSNVVRRADDLLPTEKEPTDTQSEVTVKPTYSKESAAIARQKLENTAILPPATKLEIAQRHAFDAIEGLRGHRGGEPTIGDMLKKSEGGFGLYALIRQLQNGERANTGYSSDNPESVIRSYLRSYRTSLKDFLKAEEKSGEPINSERAQLINDLLEDLSEVSDVSKINTDALGKRSQEIRDLLKIDLTKTRANKIGKTLRFDTAQHEKISSSGLLQKLKNIAPESIRSPFYEKFTRGSIVTYLKAAYPDQPELLEQLKQKQGTRTSSTIDQPFSRQDHYRSAESSGDPKETPKIIGTLSKPYTGMLYTEVHNRFVIGSENGAEFWMSGIDKHKPSPNKAESARTDQVITVTLPNQAYRQALPKPLMHLNTEEPVYFESDQSDGEFEVTTTDRFGNYERQDPIQKPQLHFDITPQEPQSLPEQLTLSQYAEKVQSPESELREYTLKSLPEHAQSFIESIRSLPIPDQVKRIEAYSKKYGFYDFDNAEVMDEKSRNTRMGDQFAFMQARLIELSLTEETADKLYAGVCTDFQSLTSAMLIANGIKTSVGVGYLVDGTEIKSTDSHVVSLVDLPTQNGGIGIFEVDGTPIAGTRGSEEQLEQLQRSAFAETLLDTTQVLEDSKEDSQENREIESVEETLPRQDSNEAPKISHQETILSLTFSPAEKQTALSIANAIRFSGLLSLTNDQLHDPQTMVWLSKAIDVASEPQNRGTDETPISDQDVMKSFTSLTAEISKLDKKSQKELHNLIQPIIKNSVAPKIAAIFKSL